MTEEQRKAALEALNVMEANEYWRRGDFSENIASAVDGEVHHRNETRSTV